MEILEIIECLGEDITAKQSRQLIGAICEYERTGNMPETKGVVKVLFSFYVNKNGKKWEDDTSHLAENDTSDVISDTSDTNGDVIKSSHFEGQKVSKDTQKLSKSISEVSNLPIFSHLNEREEREKEEEKETERETEKERTKEKDKEKDKEREEEREKDIYIYGDSDEKSDDDIESQFEILWKAYPRKLGKGKISTATKRKIAYVVGFDQMMRCISRYAKTIEGKDEQYIMYGSSFFNSGYIDYLDENSNDNPSGKPKEHVPDHPLDEFRDDDEMSDEEWIAMMEATYGKDDEDRNDEHGAISV